MQGCAGCALHMFIIITDNMFSMTIFQQMADKCLDQAAFYNLHKGTSWAFRGNGQETYHFNKMLNISALNKEQTMLWVFKEGESFISGSSVKNLPTNAGDVGSIPGWGTHSSILAWEIPWTEKPGGL